MKRYELVKLRKQLMQEVKARKRINELLEMELIKEFVKLTNVKVEPFRYDNIKEILSSILDSFTITDTNGIYVCTGTFCMDCYINYEETTYYTKEVSFDSKYADFRTYCNIENEKSERAYMKKEDCSSWYPLLVEEFEKDNIVLNPYNSCENRNGYDEVRENFFMNAIEQGEKKAKKLILSKYPRI